MRVSDSMLYFQSQTNLGGARDRLAVAQNRATTGMSVSKPSDDPTAYVKGQKESIRANRAEHRQRTISVAVMALQVADSGLSQVTEALQTIQEEVMTAATDTVSADQRAYVGQVVSALRDQILSFANTKSQGRYLFAGYTDNQQPFSAAGLYSGHAEARQVEVASGVKLPTGLTGNRVFGADGGQDIFAALGALTTALQNNHVATIRASLDSVDEAQTQVIAARSQIGAYIDSYQVASSVAEETKLQAATHRSQLVEADAFDSVSQLARAQRALETAVAVAAQLPVPGLVSSR